MFQVAIVGGGPAGLSTALFLLDSDPSLAQRIVVLEAERYPRDKICAGAVGARADRALATIGVRVEVPSVAVFGLSARTPAGELAVRASWPIGRVVRRIEFDAELARLAALRGVQIKQGARVREIARNADGFSLTLEGAKVFKTRVLVGADGVRSSVRRCLGFGRGLVAQAVEVDCEKREPSDRDDLLHFDLSDRALGGYSWDFPTPLGSRIAVSRGSYDVQRTGPDVAEALRAHLGTSEPLGPARRYAERCFQPRAPISQARCLLVGEAAGIDPVLGEGIAQAILHGEFAGRYLAQQLATDRLEFNDYKTRFLRSKAGRDLLRRSLALSATYGRGRDLVEQLSVRSEALVRLGMSLFAGERYRPSDVGRGGLDVARALLQEIKASALRS